MSALGELKKNVEGLSSVNSMLSLMPGSGSSDRQVGVVSLGHVFLLY